MPTINDAEVHPKETSDTMDMNDTVPIDGCSSFSETYTDGCPPLYVGDIEIPIEYMSTSTHSFEHRKIHNIDFHFTS